MNDIHVTPGSAYEDLTGEEGVEATQAPAAEAAGKLVWRRWAENPKTKERVLEEYELLPYLRSVEDLWHRLCESDVPLRGGTDNVDAFAGAAIKLLYLLSHKPFEYRHLRSQPELFAEVIEAWGNENVPREKTLDAVVLAFQIQNGVHSKAVAPEV